MMMASESNEKHGRLATVLVVDDDDDVRAVAVAALSERFNVIEAESGKQALDVLARKNDVDVVVTDVVMPGVSGFHVARGAQDRLRSFQVAGPSFVIGPPFRRTALGIRGRGPRLRMSASGGSKRDRRGE